MLNRPLTEDDIALGRAGTNALSYRGPDGYGEWLDEDNGVFLGHRRLAIIDPTSASDQPMIRNRLAITYNGELYNYPELRSRLKHLGADFSTAGDVEVLLRAWEHWREGALEQVDGMFAFVLWDGVHAHVAVDAFGEKPLYCANTADGLYVSSELSPLVSLLSLEPEPEGDILTEFLVMGYVTPPRTAFPCVERVSGGTKLRVRAGRVVGRERYWTPPTAAPGVGRVTPLSEGQLDRIHETFVESLVGRLRADVPMCLFLSSGVDSALTAAITSRDLGKTPHCVTVAFRTGPNADESGVAASIATQLGLPHEVVESTQDPLKVGPGELIDLFGQPCDSLTAFSIRQMSAAVRSRFKVGLTGMGGDEIFMGYGRHAHFYAWRTLYGLPQALRIGLGLLAQGVRRVGACGWPNLRHSDILRTLALCVGVRDHERYIAQKNFPTIHWLRQLPQFESLALGFAAKTTPSLESQVADIELSSVMPGSRLVSTDVGSMRASLEMRTAFLSRQLSETVASMDPRAFVAFGQKSVLRRLLRRYLPDSIVNTPKKGFIFPQERFLQTYGSSPPRLRRLSRDQTDVVWSQTSCPGWRRIAVRLIVAEAFERRFEQTA